MPTRASSRFGTCIPKQEVRPEISHGSSKAPHSCSIELPETRLRRPVLVPTRHAGISFLTTVPEEQPAQSSTSPAPVRLLSRGGEVAGSTRPARALRRALPALAPARDAFGCCSSVVRDSEVRDDQCPRAAPESSACKQETEARASSTPPFAHSHPRSPPTQLAVAPETYL